jgi:hypothetical protein
MTFRHPGCRRPPGGRPRPRPGCGSDTVAIRSAPVTDADGERPTIASTEWVSGGRRSIIVRPDGSTFAVTVPAGGMDESADDAEWAHDWIAGDRGPHRPPGLSLLHRAVLADLSDGTFVDAGRSESTR